MRLPLLAALVLALAGCTGPPGAVQEPPAPEPPADDEDMPTTPTPPAPPPPPPEGSRQQLNVTIERHAFRPADITVAPGATVTWTNLDAAAHSVALDDGTKRAGPMDTDELGALTFPTEGVYPYHCEIHASMRGVVRVEALPPPEPEPAPPAKNYTVNMTGRSFDPSVLRVSMGSTITWVNMDSEWHEAESDWAGWFGSGLLNQGQTFSVTMDRKGTFGYRCDLHSMRGTLIVE